MEGEVPHQSSAAFQQVPLEGSMLGPAPQRPACCSLSPGSPY